VSFHPVQHLLNLAHGIAIAVCSLGKVLAVSAVSKPGLATQGQPEVSPAIPLTALPVPAAILDSGGTIRYLNSRWSRVYPQAGVGVNALDWFDQAHLIEARHATFAGALEKLASGSEHSCAVDAGLHQVSVSSCEFGTLLVVCASGLPGAESERLAQSRKMEIVGRLAGGVAHDFANLLTLISGYTELLLNRINGRDHLRAELDEIRKAANRGSRLTSQLLNFARGQAVLPKPLDLNAMVVDIHKMLRPIIGENMEFAAVLEPGVCRVVADAGQMEQVLMNLILNARDAMPGGGKITIHTRKGHLDAQSALRRGMHPGPCVFLAVTDTGHGLDPETLQHIFEPFFTTKENGKGTGLGLSMVLTIIRAAGGDICVESTPGQGASFTVCLPTGPIQPETAEAPLTSRPASGSETILLVEDEEEVRRLLRYVLSKRGYQVLEASNAEDALVLFEQHADHIDLVLTDVVMPGMSGPELGERLLRQRPNLKVMYMSGYTDEMVNRSGAPGRRIDFLQKPLRPDSLASRVREALDSQPRPFNPL
jgi:two-component system, cell cycle sensor histidine kinase and response regulator CckA